MYSKTKQKHNTGMRRLRRVTAKDSYESKYGVINYMHQYSATLNNMREREFALAIKFRA